MENEEIHLQNFQIITYIKLTTMKLDHIINTLRNKNLILRHTSPTIIHKRDLRPLNVDYPTYKEGIK